MQKEHIVETLREKGCRITKQRLMLIDIILEEECQSCKEIYYKAVKADAKIGTATVYRAAKIQKITQAWKEKNIKAYTIEVHALKSAAAVVGEKELSKMAAHLEYYGNHGE